MVRPRGKIVGCALLVLVCSGTAAEAQGSVRGLVRPVREAWISTELTAEISQITRREGETFKQGELLIRFDCDKYQSELDAALAEQEVNRLALDNSAELDRRRAIGRFEVAQNKARFDKAKAQAATLAVRVKGCLIRAPFDGAVAEMKARAFEISTPNQPLMRLVSTDQLEIELIVPSDWLTWMKPGFGFSVRVDETDTDHPVRVQRITPLIDSVSQTVKIMATFADAVPGILPGMSLTAAIRKPGS